MAAPLRSMRKPGSRPTASTRKVAAKMSKGANKWNPSRHGASDAKLKEA